MKNQSFTCIQLNEKNSNGVKHDKPSLKKASGQFFGILCKNLLKKHLRLVPIFFIKLQYKEFNINCENVINLSDQTKKLLTIWNTR